MALPPNREIAPPEGTGSSLPRREFLRRLALATAAGLATPRGTGPAAASALAPGGSVFPDGIKAGDPTPGGCVLWTRVAAPTGRGPVEVVWSVAEGADMERVVRGGVVTATADDGHIAKIDVRHLASDRWYSYRFEAGGGVSPVGRLRTAPAVRSQPDRLRYAFASCQQRTESHYVAHRAIIQENVDFLMHLGDYVYVSDGGTLTLDDYRGVYRTFHSNPLLQELHAAVPLVAVWDDGEFYNGVDRSGDPTRLAAARQAWFEAMPMRRPRTDRIHRSLRWGRLAEVLMLDTRQYRDPQIPANSNFAGVIEAQDTRYPPCDQMFAPGRTTLGVRQRKWLERRLRVTGARWRVIGSSYDMAPWKFIDYDTPAARAEDPALQRNGGLYVSNEAWDDYQAERRLLMSHIEREHIPNVLVTSGHTHFYKASDIMPDFDDLASPITAMEFVTGSLTADPDPRTIAPEDVLHVAENIMLAANAPYLKQVDLLRQGYAVVDITPEETLVEFRGIDTLDPAAEASTFARFRVVAGRPGIEVLA